MIADEYRKLNYEVHEEKTCFAVAGSLKRFDILAIDKNTRNAYNLDSTIRYEASESQPVEVDEEKKCHYEPTLPDLTNKYNNVEVIGLMIGARGTIPNFFDEFRHRFNLPKSINNDIVVSVIKDSVYILRNHPNNFN